MEMPAYYLISFRVVAAALTMLLWCRYKARFPFLFLGSRSWDYSSWFASLDRSCLSGIWSPMIFAVRSFLFGPSIWFFLMFSIHRPLSFQDRCPVEWHGAIASHNYNVTKHCSSCLFCLMCSLTWFLLVTRIKIFLYVLLKDIAFSIDPEIIIEKKVK